MSVALHLAAAWWLASALNPAVREPAAQKQDTVLTMVQTQPTEPPPPPPPPSPPARQPDRSSPAAPETAVPPPASAAPASPQPGAAYMDAPPAPSDAEWALAATYTLKNSKRYRYNWGQQVRSMMGTAHEGPGQGTVRFRIEIAPDGTLARLDTLWTTSAAVEQSARQAVQRMPALPPTPNGQPLIFEKTIVFDAWSAEAPPLYKDDCLPEPRQHGNRFVWDGRSPQITAPEPEADMFDPQAYAECLKLLPQDSIEAEAASDKRQLEQWGSQTLGR